MSRKSKTTILKEKLALISDCPTDIFDKLDNEDLLGMIQDAENGNTEAIAELSVLLFKTYGNARIVNRSLGYILEKGVGLSVPRSAEILIMHAAKNNECLDYVTRAIDLIDYCDINIDEGDRLNAKFKSIIRSAENMRSLEAKKKDLEDFDRDRQVYGELYLIYKSLVQTGKYDVEYTRSILADASLPPILDLPSFSDGKRSVPEEIKDDWCESLIRALHICSLDAWQDFWLRCIYEYCIVYLNSDFTAFAEDIAIALNHRRFSRKSSLHALAFIEYLIDNTPPDSEKHDQLADWYRRVSEECVLDGTLSNLKDKPNLRELMEEAAYTSEYAARIKTESGNLLGNPIQHFKNRYTLNCSLSNHAKRANKHMWETVLSIKQDSDTIPEFRNIKVRDRSNTVNRGGQELKQQKKLSQILCDGEIVIGEKVSPFVLDLILDISYVSTTKCENVEIKVKSAKNHGSSLTMSCQILLS